MLRLHNTATGEKEDFRPIEAGRVRLYTCGPTVWNFAHVGNFRTFLFYDLLRRHLLTAGHRLTHVLNLTDVEDRIIRLAAERGTTIRAYVEPFEVAFLEDLATLRIQMPEHMPRATEYVAEMAELIGALLANGNAYPAEDGVYYRVASFPAYGELAHLDRAGLKVGARVAQDDYDKESLSDFALWKAEQPGEAEVGASWDSAIGRGRPGWHIECSAMSRSLLGDTMDIHAGGIDLLFPHHQNEVAQSEAANGVPLANYWLHAAHLADSTGAKMSKRLGNIATLRDLLDAGHDPLAIRFFLLAGAHYRKQLRMDEEAIASAAGQVRRFQEFSDRVERQRPQPDPQADRERELVAQLEQLGAQYRAALDDDLNLPQGVGHLFEAIRLSNSALDQGLAGETALAVMRSLLTAADAHLDILRREQTNLEEKIERLIAEREEARAGRDFARADAIREELRTQGILLEDSRTGIRWRRSGPGGTG